MLNQETNDFICLFASHRDTLYSYSYYKVWSSWKRKTKKEPGCHWKDFFHNNFFWWGHILQSSIRPQWSLSLTSVVMLYSLVYAVCIHHLYTGSFRKNGQIPEAWWKHSGIHIIDFNTSRCSVYIEESESPMSGSLRDPQDLSEGRQQYRSGLCWRHTTRACTQTFAYKHASSSFPLTHQVCVKRPPHKLF